MSWAIFAFIEDEDDSMAGFAPVYTNGRASEIFAQMCEGLPPEWTIVKVKMKRPSLYRVGDFITTVKVAAARLPPSSQPPQDPPEE